MSRDVTPEVVIPFVQHLGIHTHTPTATALLPDRSALSNHVGTVHAGAIFTAAETATGQEILRLLTTYPVAAIPVVRSASIRDRAPATGTISARATTVLSHDELAVDIERHGRATRSIDAAVTALDGTLVAEATIEWVFLGDAQPS